MTTPEALEEQVMAEVLPLELKMAVERSVLKLCNAYDDATTMAWIVKYDKGLNQVMQTNRDVKDLALAGKIEEAATLAKHEVESYYGHKVNL